MGGVIGSPWGNGEHMANREFTDDELLRYSRQIMLPQFDVAGQQRLAAARVLIVGLGGLGSPVALYLAGAGVGELVLADFDQVELTNLHRQIAHTMADLGKLKVESARESIGAINPLVQVRTISEPLQDELLVEQVGLVDVVVDCTDNFATRFALNSACVAAGKPLISGAAIRMEGQISVFDTRQPQNPCYQCLYAHVDEEQLTCSEAGVMAPLVGIVGSVQAMETIKVLTGLGEPLAGRLLLLDGMSLSWREFRVKRDPQCSVCGERTAHQ